MSIARVFLEWRRPPLESAAEYLFGRYRRGGEVAMRDAIVITPVVSGGRRLLEILLERAEADLELAVADFEREWAEGVATPTGAAAEVRGELQAVRASAGRSATEATAKTTPSE